jgi:hypothetical protein
MMIRFLGKALIEGILLIALFFGALTLYCEYGPVILGETVLGFVRNDGTRVVLEIKSYRMIPQRRKLTSPPIKLIPPGMTQKG